MLVRMTLGQALGLRFNSLDIVCSHNLILLLPVAGQFSLLQNLWSKLQNIKHIFDKVHLDISSFEP